MSALRNDDICVALAGFNELQVHRLDCVCVVADGSLNGTAALCDVSDYDAHKAVIVVGVYEYLDIHLVAELLAGKDEDSFHYYDFSRLYGHGFGLGPGAGDVGVYRLLDRLALLEFTYLLAQKFPVDGIGVVEVDFLPFFRGKMAGVLVIGVLGNYNDPAFKLPGDGFYNGGLS